MGYTILNDCFKPFCYDVLLCEFKIESLGDEMTLIYKGHTFDDMVKAINENKDLKREIELLQGQVSYYEDKLEESIYVEEALDDLEKENESLRKENTSLQANIDILNNNIRLQEVTKRDEVLNAIFDILCDFYDRV